MSDLIERQKAIDELISEPPEMNYGFYYAEKIKALPPAQPKIVRCKECLMHCVCKFEQGLGLDGYCSQAKRRTDEAD